LSDNETKECPVCGENMTRKTRPQSTVAAVGENGLPAVIPAREGWQCDDDECGHWVDEERHGG